MVIAIATTTRADWGLLSPLAAELRHRGADVRILASGMHYDSVLGLTHREIEADGFQPVPLPVPTDTPEDECAECLRKYAEALRTMRPDALVCLGDRSEMLAIAVAATLTRTPIVHIAGGAVSEGAYDDRFRNAITQLADLHLTETEEYRRNVINMGVDPAKVLNTGAIGVHNIQSLEPMPQRELEESIGFELGPKCVLCTMHAATLSDISPEESYRRLLHAFGAVMDEDPEVKILFTHPNNDTDPAPLIAMLRAFATARPGRVVVVPSLGRRRYLSALRYVAAVAGNSSSGIVEVPSAGIPTLDIGIRQKGRARGTSVHHADCTPAAIAAGLHRVLSPSARACAASAPNPYGRPDTLTLMANAILTLPPNTKMHAVKA